MNERDELDPLDLTAQERAKAEHQTRRRLTAREDEDEIRFRMRSRLGRRGVWRQLEEAGVFRSTFSTNALAMAFAEGNRNAGLRTLSLIHEHCAELYAVMVKENAKASGNEQRDTSS